MKNKKIVIFAIVIIVVIAIIAGALYIVNRNTPKPEETLSAYISLLNEQKYEEMYNMISEYSKTQISQEDFIKRNKNIYEGIDAYDIKVTPSETTKDGKTYSIKYNESMSTSAGTISFENTAKLVRENKEYKISWTSSMIFPELRNTDKVRVSTLSAKRGEILDRNGAKLAQNGSISSVGIVPGKLGENKTENISKISELTGVSTDYINTQISASYVKDDTFVPIKKVSADNTELKSKLLEIPGIKITSVDARVYPLGEEAAHLIGYVQAISAEELKQKEGKGYNSSSIIGKAGLEQAYEDTLRGIDGTEIYIADENGNKLKTLATQDKKDGTDVKLTIDGGIQKNLILLLHNLTNTAGQFSSTRLGCQLDFSTTFKFLFRKMGSQGNFIAGTLRMVLAILGVVSVFCLKKTWKTILLMVCLIIGVPSISYTYTAIFMILPIIYFLDSDEIKKWDLLYLVGMLLVMVPIPFCWTEGAGDPNYAYMNVTIPMLIECVALVIMSVSLIVEGIINLGCRKWVKICGIVVVLIISVVPNVATLNLPYAYTDYLKKTLSDKIELEDGDYLEQTFIPKKEKVTHIVLKLKSSKKGSLEISVKQCNNESLIITKEYDLSKSQNGYNEIDLNNIEVESGKKYQIRIVYKNSEDKKIKIWKTVDNYMDEDNILTLNGEAINGELGIQIYEK